MYLSRLILNLKSAQVRRELANVYEIHRTIMGAFPDGEEGPGRVLFRIEESQEAKVTILVQSSKCPDWGKARLAPGYLDRPVDWKVFEPIISNGQKLRFRLLANPTVKRDGRRIGIFREEELKSWLSRKAEAAGFSIEQVMILPRGIVDGVKTAYEDGLEFSSVIFEGILEVKEERLFLESLESGIGSAKGFGFGLMSIAPEG